MAHANPEFALGLMRPTTGPISAEKRDLPTFRDLSRKMAKIAAMRPGQRSDAEAAMLAKYERGLARIRREAAGISIPGCVREPKPDLVEVEHTRPDRPKAGERFIEPKRRLPTDMQAGRVKERRAPKWN